MRRIPKIGEFVSYDGSNVIGQCSGVVRKIYPAYHPEQLTQLPFTPEAWRASVEVADLPSRWPYSSNRFAPEIAALSSQ